MPYETEEEILKLAVIDEELAAILSASSRPPPDYSDLSNFKVEYAQMSAALGSLIKVPKAVQESETTYTAKDGTSLRAKVYQPGNLPPAGSPLVVMFHGGGFCVGVPEEETQTCYNLVQAFSAVCISVQYRLAPEFPFPYAITDAWDALQWAAANAASFGADPNLGFIVGGTSAGGHITAVLSHLARDNHLSPPITGQYLAVPHLCPEDRIPEQYRQRLLSYKQNQDAPILPQAAIDMFLGAYNPDHDDGVNYSILIHPEGHSNLPPAYFQVCGLDPMRDEALIYETILREESGVATKLDMYQGVPHCHWAFLPMLKKSLQFREDQIRGFGWLLKKEPSPLVD